MVYLVLLATKNGKLNCIGHKEMIAHHNRAIRVGFRVGFIDVMLWT